MYDRVTLLYSRHWHNIVSQPYFNLKIQVKQQQKKKEEEEEEEEEEENTCPNPQSGS